MFRRQLISMLLDHPMSVAQIARATGLPTKEVVADLKHLEMSLRHGDYEMDFIPAECRKCEFEFTQQKFTRPGKCPQCRGTWIYEPMIAVRTRTGQSARKTQSRGAMAD